MEEDAEGDAQGDVLSWNRGELAEIYQYPTSSILCAKSVYKINFEVVFISRGALATIEGPHSHVRDSEGA